jgi:hypothetical protein
MLQGLVALLLLLLLPLAVQGVLLAGKRQARSRSWDGVEEELGVEARRGYKTAQVLIDARGAATFAGITEGGAYRAEARASCARARCRAPAPECVCGFYAFKRRADALELLRQTLACNGLRHKALLTVELEGSVLQYERGYRAERQRVLAVAFEPECAFRVRGALPHPADRLVAVPTARARSLYAVPGSPAGPGAPLRPVCDDHVPTGARAFRPVELAGLLGTEVGWLRAA